MGRDDQRNARAADGRGSKGEVGEAIAGIEGAAAEGAEGAEGAELLTSSARRFLSEAQLAPDPELAAQGWERRFIADARRAEEALALYRELGFEVRAEPVRADEVADDCQDCRLLMLLGFKTIYTRRTKGAKI